MWFNVSDPDSPLFPNTVYRLKLDVGAVRHVPWFFAVSTLILASCVVRLLLCRPRFSPFSGSDSRGSAGSPKPSPLCVVGVHRRESL